jgi:Phage integrase family
VSAALLMGARFGELAQRRVADFDPVNGSIFIRQSKSGRARYVPVTDDGLAFFMEQAFGKRGHELLLHRTESAGWGRMVTRGSSRSPQRGRADAPQLARLRHAYASTLAVKGAPLIVVANASRPCLKRNGREALRPSGAKLRRCRNPQDGSVWLQDDGSVLAVSRYLPRSLPRRAGWSF